MIKNSLVLVSHCI